MAYTPVLQVYMPYILPAAPLKFHVIMVYICIMHKYVIYTLAFLFDLRCQSGTYRYIP